VIADDRLEEGIYLGLPEETYHGAHGLSNSAMKALAVSPLFYQHQCIDRVQEEPSSQARFGSLVHCRLLEPKRFAETYAVPPSVEAYPGALVTMEHLKAWCAERSVSTSCKVKAELVERVQSHATLTGESVVVWDAVQAAWQKENANKRLLSHDEAERIRSIATVVREDETASKLLSSGYPEVSIFVRDPESGVLLKSRQDFWKTAATIDLKTFGRRRGESPKQAVNKALWYEGYFRQGVFYSRVRDLARQRLAEGTIRVHGDVPADWLAKFVEARDHDFAFLFVEADAPHHLDFVKLRRTTMFGEDVRLYWGEAERWIDARIAEYADCLRRFGDEPWRDSLEGRTLDDMDMPQLAFQTEAAS
jgi:hypothetical protein